MISGVGTIILQTKGQAACIAVGYGDRHIAFVQIQGVSIINVEVQILADQSTGIWFRDDSVNIINLGRFPHSVPITSVTDVQTPGLVGLPDDTVLTPIARRQPKL